MMGGVGREMWDSMIVTVLWYIKSFDCSKQVCIII